MEQTQPEVSDLTGCSKPLRACAVIAAIVCVGLILLLIYAARIPQVKRSMQCRNNMDVVGKALQRYADVNGKYPADLQALKKEYLKDSSVLWCPGDNDRTGVSSFTYHRPEMNSPDTFVMLEMDLGKLGKDMPPVKLKMQKDGNIITTRPSIQEIERRSRENAK